MSCKILMVASEVVPFAKTGGLADVAGSLSYFMAQHGDDVKIVMPFYQIIKEKYNPSLVIDNYEIKLGSEKENIKIYELEYKEVQVYFIEHEMFDRTSLYGTKEGDFPDNHKRFSLFSEAAMRLPLLLKWQVDIIHLHDWQSALIPLLLKTSYNLPDAYRETKTLLTIHNLGYQGLFPKKVLNVINIPQSEFNVKSLEFYGKVNFLKAGIVHASIINTVSKKYSEEIQTPEYGYGLEGILSDRKENLYGILNGIDYEEWNPKTDQYLFKNYDKKNLKNKQFCKEFLFKEYKINNKYLKKPVFGIISRLASQKGLDLILESVDNIAKLNMELVLLGTGEEKYEKGFEKASQKYENINVKIGFDIKLAHQIEAGCDFFLMPSRYEPCGLSQMHSLRYGTIPVARATGGLENSIIDIKDNLTAGTGIKFVEYTTEAMMEAIKRALFLYENEKNMLQIIYNGMNADFSWDSSASHYEKLYKKILNK